MKFNNKSEFELLVGSISTLVLVGLSACSGGSPSNEQKTDHINLQTGTVPLPTQIAETDRKLESTIQPFPSLTPIQPPTLDIRPSETTISTATQFTNKESEKVDPPTTTSTHTPSATPSPSPTFTPLPTVTPTTTRSITPTPETKVITTETTPTHTSQVENPNIQLTPIRLNPQAGPPSVIIYFVDNMGNTEFQAAHTPNMDQLAEEGITFANSYTIRNSRSIPARLAMHYSMNATDLGFSGDPGIQSLDYPQPALPEELSAIGVPTLYAANKDKFLKIVVDQHGNPILGADYIIEYQNDAWVTEQFLKELNDAESSTKPRVFIADYGDPDKVNHAYNCGSREHLGAITYADGQIGKLRKEIKSREDKTGEKYVEMVIVDHGCHSGAISDNTLGPHGDASEDDMRTVLITDIPLGSNLSPGTEIHSRACIYDLAPTILKIYGQDNFPGEWRGVPLPIFADVTVNSYDYNNPSRCNPG